MTESDQPETPPANTELAPPPAQAAAPQCNSINGFNRIVRMGFNTFFLNIFDVDFVGRVYDRFYSINGIRLNPQSIRQKYISQGIYRRQFVNSGRVIINFDIVRACNTGYSGLSNFEVTQKLFREGICDDAVIDSVPVQKCGEALDTFDILDYDILDDCSESNDYVNTSSSSCDKSYNFFLDLFDWRFVASCNRNIVKSGYTGCVGVTEWYITQGIYEGVPFNRQGNYIDLDFVACANDLRELGKYREVVCYIMQFGICDEEILLAVPEAESCATQQLNGFNYTRFNRITQVLDQFVRTQCVSAEGANSAATCGRGRRRSGILFPPDAQINWASYPTSSSAPPAEAATNPSTNNNLGNTTAIQNFGFFNPQPAALPSSSTSYLSYPSAASRNRYNSQNEHFKVRAQEQIITQQLNPNTTRSTSNTSAAAPIENSVPVIPGACKCGTTSESFATANTSASANLPNTCPNCVRQFNAYQNINENVGPITPLTLTTQPFSAPLNGTPSNSVLVNRANGNFNTTSGISGLINANNGVGFGLCGDSCSNRSISQPYYDNGTGTNFRSPYRSAFFS